MMNLDEAIQHCKEKAKEQRSKAIGYFNGGYSSQIEGKSCLNCAEEHEQLAEWLMELKKLREENVNQFLNSKEIILALIEENKALRKQRPQGEWLFTEIDENYHVYGQCSVCKERNRIGKACRSCGAEMKGGAE